MIAGTGDDKTDILIIADAYDRQAIYSRDRNITSNAQAMPFGGGDSRSSIVRVKLKRIRRSMSVGSRGFIMRPGLRRSNTALCSECPD